MTLYVFSLISSLLLLFWSANRFVDGAAKVSTYFKMSPLFVGMFVIGFGTSAPELFVSTISSYLGQDNIALGNAYGSNIVNIALILGITAIIKPIKVLSSILRKELLILLVVTAISAYLLLDLKLSRVDASILLLIFVLFIYYAIKESRKKEEDTFSIGIESSLDQKQGSIKLSLFKLISGLVILIISSRLFSWASVSLAKSLGVSDVIIGFTIVAIGTSLPELISSIVAAIKGESDLAFGNIIGSNLFNTLAVVSASGLIKPLTVSNEILTRDVSAMCGITLILFVFGIGIKSEGRINRVEGVALILFYLGYSGYLISANL
ncbi:MAG: calcium/sodium antiporter [Bacteriovoracaceae bacterium]|nr:calcium/sodium antiporter [Bacteriovoracaceae bacterium]